MSDLLKEYAKMENLEIQRNALENAKRGMNFPQDDAFSYSPKEIVFYVFIRNQPQNIFFLANA